jgi:hypothetical protein
MTVHIDEVSTVIEPAAGGEGGMDEASDGAGQSAEVRIEELRPLVRALVAEEIERWLRSRGECQ